MRQRGLSALLLVSPENIYYLLGLNHQGYFAFTCMVLFLEGRPVLVTRAMESPTVAAQVPDCVHAPYRDDEDPASTVVRAIREHMDQGGAIGLEHTSMFFPLDIWTRIQEALPMLEWCHGSGLVDQVRAVKSRAEIACIRAAAAASDQAMQAGLAIARAGVTEREIAANVLTELIKAGSDIPGCGPFIRSSRNLLQEHVTWSGHELRAGDALFIEMSGSVARYHAPLTRMLHIGSAPPTAAKSAELAMAGFAAVSQALKPGATSAEVYAAWQDVIDRGLGHTNYRRHHCGYMVGIGFPPSWVGGSMVVGLRRGSDLQIQEGMVFHVLSWILGQALADHAVSDTVLVTSAGGEVLTTTSRDLHIIR